MSGTEIEAMLIELDGFSKEYLSQECCLPTTKTARGKLHAIVQKHTTCQPLPVVPADATCGGCRWFRIDPDVIDPQIDGVCYSEPQYYCRDSEDPACKHY